MGETGYLVLVKMDEQWIVVPDTRIGPSASLFKVRANAQHRLEEVAKLFPTRLFRLAEVIY